MKLCSKEMEVMIIFWVEYFIKNILNCNSIISLPVFLCSFFFSLQPFPGTLVQSPSCPLKPMASFSLIIIVTYICVCIYVWVYLSLFLLFVFVVSGLILLHWTSNKSAHSQVKLMMILLAFIHCHSFLPRCRELWKLPPFPSTCLLM